MKQTVVSLAATLMCIAGCATPPRAGAPSIVGVWEMTEVTITRLSEVPPVALTNKKDVYTADGVYHDTAAESTRMTDMRPRTYTFEDGVVTIHREGRPKPRRATVRFLSHRKMVMTTPDGTSIVFTKVSDDPDRIPKLRERVVPVRMK